MAVVQFAVAARQGETERRLLQARSDLGVDAGQNILGDAYNRVIRDHPELTGDGERFDQAMALALDSLQQAVRYLNNDVVCIADIKKK